MLGNDLVKRELAKLMGVLSHPHRIKIIEELRDGERPVSALQSVLQVSHSCASQHLGIMRAERIVLERREGRHVYYKLIQPDLLHWLAESLKFLESDARQSRQLLDAVEESRGYRRESQNGVERASHTPAAVDGTFSA
jgi:DNA-binding transcriptional ArsR family regulator